MGVNIVTGRKGEAHITSDDERARNAEMFGKGKFVFDCGGRLWANKTDDNHVSIASGMCMSYGTQMGVEPWDTETVFIENGSTGYQRHDLIVMRYTRDISEDTESAELAVIKGSPVQQNPHDPTYTDGNILEGAILDETPLFRVVLNGTTIASIEPVYKLRSGYIPTDPDDPDPQEPEIDPDNTLVITEATVDRLWNGSLEDGDSEVYNGE